MYCRCLVLTPKLEIWKSQLECFLRLLFCNSSSRDSDEKTLKQPYNNNLSHRLHPINHSDVDHIAVITMVATPHTTRNLFLKSSSACLFCFVTSISEAEGFAPLGFLYFGGSLPMYAFFGSMLWVRGDGMGKAFDDGMAPERLP